MQSYSGERLVPGTPPAMSLSSYFDKCLGEMTHHLHGFKALPAISDLLDGLRRFRATCWLMQLSGPRLGSRIMSVSCRTFYIQAAGAPIYICNISVRPGIA